MDYNEARSWLKGERSVTNLIPQEPRETWLMRIAVADAAMMQQAYIIVKAYKEELLGISHLIYLYNRGYQAGHHDTVEGTFTDIFTVDMDTYHADVVIEIMEEK